MFKCSEKINDRFSPSVVHSENELKIMIMYGGKTDLVNFTT